MGFADINALVHEMEELVRSREPTGYRLTGGSTDALLVAADAVMVLSGAAQAAGAPPEVEKLVRVAQAAHRRRAGGPRQARRAGAGAAAPRPGPRRRRPRRLRSRCHAAPTPAAAPRAARRRSRRSASAARRRAVGPAGAHGGRRRTRSASPAEPGHAHQRGDQPDQVARRRELARAPAGAVARAGAAGPRGGGPGARGRARSRRGSTGPRRWRPSCTARQAARQRGAARLCASSPRRSRRMRMLPLSVLFEPYPRMVRDLARELGKEVELVVEGEDTRADRSVLEALRDPLMHLVRNALDHGLETREERVGGRQAAAGQADAARRARGRAASCCGWRTTARGWTRRCCARWRCAGADGRGGGGRAVGRGGARLDLPPGFSSKEVATDISGRGRGAGRGAGAAAGAGRRRDRGVRARAGAPSSSCGCRSRSPWRRCSSSRWATRRLCLSAVARRPGDQGGAASRCGRWPGARRCGSRTRCCRSRRSPRILGHGAGARAAEGELVLLVGGRAPPRRISVDRVLEERVQAVLPLKGVLVALRATSPAPPRWRTAGWRWCSRRPTSRRADGRDRPPRARRPARPGGPAAGSWWWTTRRSPAS